MNFNLIWPTWATTTRSHLQHVPDSDAAQNWSVWSLQRVIRKVPSRPLFGHVYVIDCHYDYADRAYWDCYRQGHFPGNPCCVITTWRYFRQDIFSYYLHVGASIKCSFNLDDAVLYTLSYWRYDIPISEIFNL